MRRSVELCDKFDYCSGKAYRFFIKKRDAFIEDTKNWTITELGDGSKIITITDLKLPTSKEDIHD